MITELESDNLAEIISEKENVVVLFMATWCGNCRKMKPKFKKLAQDTEGVEFVVVDAEKFCSSRKLAKITNLPTFATYHSGELLSQIETSEQQPLIDLVDGIKQKLTA